MATPSSTVIIDGVEVDITAGTDTFGNPTRTLVVPVVTSTREDGNGNALADIPVTTSEDGGPALTAHLPTGYGMQVTVLTDEQPITDGPALLQAQIETHVPAPSQAAMNGTIAAQWVLMGVSGKILLSTVMPTMAAERAPGAVMQVSNSVGNFTTAVLIDTNGLGDAAHMAVRGFSFTLITGGGTFDHVIGRANIIADGASQTIVLDGGVDQVSAGGGNDRIIVGESIQDTIGHVAFNTINGGEDYDTLQLKGDSRDDYTFFAFDMGDGRAAFTFSDTDRPNLIYKAFNIEAFQFAEAVADTTVRGSVTRLYETLLERSPDAGSLDYWMRTLAGDTALVDVTQAILASDELAGKVPQSNAAYITWLYDQVLGRAADAGGLAYWTATLASDGISRADLALALVDSAEKLAQDASNEIAFGATDVGVLIRMYDALYDRQPDLAGLNYWVDRLEDGTSLADIADSFVDAAESTGRLDDPTFVAQLYRMALEREATTIELADWAGLLAQGHVDRGDVLLALAESAEMVELVGVMSTTFELA
ncbi:hypothetical protein RCH14_003955 [Massilia sp. MP_M2]|uniref:DUF4214 domain-containing protein n=1 Tax=Massilia sp. MP_M2 TaxID=3071713 RepID=UPI00319E7151